MIQTHDVGQGQFVVSENSSWIPGIYDSAETARFAALSLSDQDIVAFLEHIYVFNGENRPVTRADVETTIAAVRFADA